MPIIKNYQLYSCTPAMQAREAEERRMEELREKRMRLEEEHFYATQFVKLAKEFGFRVEMEIPELPSEESLADTVESNPLRRVCSTCGRSLPLDEFHYNSHKCLKRSCIACEESLRAERREFLKTTEGKTKECSICHRILPLHRYYFADAAYNGLFNYCKDCHREKEKTRRQRAKEKENCNENEKE